MFFKGSYVALITPFTKDNKIDEEKVRELVNYHIKNGSSGISPCGTTGESPTLSYEEHKKMIQIVVDEAKNRIHVLAGAGANSTREAIELSKFAEEAGADSILSITPYYNKPTQKGLYAHYAAISSETKLPIMLYNAPGRSGVCISPETVLELSKIDSIKGIKEASGNLERVSHIINICGDKIDVVSGDDALLLPMLSVGATGVVSVSANFVAKEISDLIIYFEQGQTKEAQKLHNKLFRLNSSMFLETNPIPVKAAMEMLGIINSDVRLPLTPLDEIYKIPLENILKEFGLLS